MSQPNPQPVAKSDNTIWIYLSYILGWLFGLIGLAVVKDDDRVRFHCAQAFVLSAAVSIVCFVLAFTFIVPFILGPAVFIYGIILAVQAGKGENPRVPLCGDFAEKNVVNWFK